ncbi:MAG: ABC transporter permease [Verrucomicrobiota bacterium]|nr:ABC transporter permease [Verrucomicrobiota bacterium]
MNDLRFAFRTLLKTPSFSLTSILALGLGIGATTAMFGVIYGFLLRPLPYARPNELVMLQSRSNRSGSDLGVNYLDFKDWQEQARSFSGMAFFNLRWNGNLESRDGRTETLKTTFTTANLFNLLGVQPIFGRNLTDADDEESAAKVMLISHRLWSALGREESLIGQPLRLDGTSRTVVGVMPPGFRFPSQSDIWVPMASVFGAWLKGGNPRDGNRSWRADQAMARLKPDVTLSQASAEMSLIAQRLAQQYPTTNADVGAAVVGLREHWVGNLRGALLLLLGACGGVLAIACANVSQLLLARATIRERELAVRAALGASRQRLVRQLLTESALLGILGSVAGTILAFWLVEFVRVAIPIELPFWVKIDVNRGVLAFSAAIAVLTGLLAGTLPALHSTRFDLTHSLRNMGGSLRIGKTRELLTVAQVAVSIVLLVGASVMLRAVMQLRRVDPGFDSHQVVMMEMNPTYNGEEPAQKRMDRYSKITESIAQIPGVELVAANNSPPFVPQRPWNRAEVAAEGQSIDQQKSNPLANFQTVSSDYFKLLHIPLLQGRVFDERDNLSAPQVCIISARLAQRIWPNEQSIGRRLKLGSLTEDAEWLTVVGVVGDVRHQGLDRDFGPDFYKPSLQLAWKQMHYLVRARNGIDPLSLVPAVRAQVAAASPETGVFNFGSLEKEMSDSLWQPRLQGWLLGFFSIVALTLAASGLYGAMAYGVAQRTREIGIRMALGATRARVLRLVLGQGMRAVAIGLLCGLSGAFVLSRLLGAVVHPGNPHDLTSYFIACLALMLAALLACWLPARRATRVNPSDALRTE